MREIALQRLQEFVEQRDIERLRQHAHIDVTRALQLFRIAGDENHRELRLESLHAFREIDAVQRAGHMDVGNHEVEGQGLARLLLPRVRGVEAFHRRVGVEHAGHVVAHHLQQRFRARRDFVVVLDEQNAQAMRRADCIVKATELSVRPGLRFPELLDRENVLRKALAAQVAAGGVSLLERNDRIAKAHKAILTEEAERLRGAPSEGQGTTPLAVVQWRASNSDACARLGGNSPNCY